MGINQTVAEMPVQAPAPAQRLYEQNQGRGGLNSVARGHGGLNTSFQTSLKQVQRYTPQNERSTNESGSRRVGQDGHLTLRGAQNGGGKERQAYVEQKLKEVLKDHPELAKYAGRSGYKEGTVMGKKGALAFAETGKGVTITENAFKSPYIQTETDIENTIVHELTHLKRVAEGQARGSSSPVEEGHADVAAKQHGDRKGGTSQAYLNMLSERARQGLSWIQGGIERLLDKIR